MLTSVYLSATMYLTLQDLSYKKESEFLRDHSFPHPGKATPVPKTHTTFAEFLRAGTIRVPMSSRGRMEAMAAQASTASNRTESWPTSNCKTTKVIADQQGNTDVTVSMLLNYITTCPTALLY